ncbi:MAG: DUF3592 domain-containing protein [Bryobacter sp.]|jgi:hypothetical protein|nr:DUF3592 domain-containing protein [Bryobacter sp.]
MQTDSPAPQFGLLLLFSAVLLPLIYGCGWLARDLWTERQHVAAHWTRVEAKVLELNSDAEFVLEYPWQGAPVRFTEKRKTGTIREGTQVIGVWVNPQQPDERRIDSPSHLWTGVGTLAAFGFFLLGVWLFLVRSLTKFGDRFVEHVHEFSEEADDHLPRDDGRPLELRPGVIARRSALAGIISTGVVLQFVLVFSGALPGWMRVLTILLTAAPFVFSVRRFARMWTGRVSADYHRILLTSLFGRREVAYAEIAGLRRLKQSRLGMPAVELIDARGKSQLRLGPDLEPAPEWEMLIRRIQERSGVKLPESP